MSRLNNPNSPRRSSRPGSSGGSQGPLGNLGANLPQLPPTGPVTKWLCIALFVVSLVGAVTERNYGLGLNLLTFHIDAVVRDLELWRLLTYPFVERTPFGLIISALILWLFGRYFEQQWGSRDFFSFFLWSSFGAALLAMPLSLLVDALMPFSELGVAEGPAPALDALLVAMALNAPDSRILFGFVLPMRVRTVIFIILGIQVIGGIQTGGAAISITLGGMAMGYLLVTGNWRPSRWSSIFGYKRGGPRGPRSGPPSAGPGGGIGGRHRGPFGSKRRHGLYVVPPKDKTLH